MHKCLTCKLKNTCEIAHYVWVCDSYKKEKEDAR